MRTSPEIWRSDGAVLMTVLFALCLVAVVGCTDERRAGDTGTEELRSFCVAITDDYLQRNPRLNVVVDLDEAALEYRENEGRVSPANEDGTERLMEELLESVTENERRLLLRFRDSGNYTDLIPGMEKDSKVPQEIRFWNNRSNEDYLVLMFGKRHVDLERGVVVIEIIALTSDGNQAQSIAIMTRNVRWSVERRWLGWTS